MPNYVFLKQIEERNPDGIISVISESAIEDTRLCDVYGDYGQKTGHVYAGSVVCLLSDKAVSVANTWAVENDESPNYKIQSNIIAPDQSYLFDEILEKCTEDKDYDLEVPIIQAITYHDGRNWKTICLDGEEYGVFVEYERITDEEDKLTAIIENKVYIGESAGYKYFQSNEHRVTQSAWATDFELYEITLDEYLVSINTAKLDAIITDNKYAAEDIKNDFDSHPEGWDCILENELSFDQMTDGQREEFKRMLFEYADENAFK